MELRNSDGALISGANVSIMIRNYYKDLFVSSRPTEIEEVVQSIESVVTEDMNSSLISAFS